MKSDVSGRDPGGRQPDPEGEVVKVSDFSRVQRDRLIRAVREARERCAPGVVREYDDLLDILRACKECGGTGLVEAGCCNCAGGTPESSYLHERYCGVEPCPEGCWDNLSDGQKQRSLAGEPVA